MILNPDGEDPMSLGDLLAQQVETHAALQVYILCWDFAPLYPQALSLLQRLKMGWPIHERIHLRYDGVHPVGACHHQKVVVIDDTYAFCGGLDLTLRRWDLPGHTPGNQRRSDPLGKLYLPFHDVQIAVGGEVAHALGVLARERWEVSGEGKIAFRKGPATQPIENNMGLSCEGTVAIARTLRGVSSNTQVGEIDKLNCDIIYRTQKYLYIETQYLTSRSMENALRGSLSKKEGPEIILVLPQKAGGWVECVTMGVLQAGLLSRLRRADRYGRLFLYYPFDKRFSRGEYTIVHSKVIISDDKIIKIGSSNLTNRSMGLDTECDLCIETDHKESVRKVLYTLLRDHTGRFDQPIEQTISINDTLIKMSTNNKFLKRFKVTTRYTVSSKLIQYADLSEPIEGEKLLEKTIWRPRKVRRSVLFRMAVPFAGLLLVAGLLATFPLDKYFLNLQSLPLSRYELLAINTLGFTLIPIPGIALGVLAPINSLLLEGWVAFLLVLAGSLISASVGYVIGRLMKRPSERTITEMAKKIQKERRLSLLGIALIRIFPIAPWFLVSRVIGSVRFPFVKFFIGTAIGITPGLFAILSFQTLLFQLILAPTAIHFPLFVLLVVIGVVLYQQLWKRTLPKRAT